MGAPKYVIEGGYLCGLAENGWATEIPLSRVGEVVFAADYDRDVAEAETRGWNAGVEAAIELLQSANDPISDQSFPLDIGKTLGRMYAAGDIAALRKPEVEG